MSEDNHCGSGPQTNFAEEFWDVAVIGTGMGGATVGHQLAKAGHRVIFLEKGLADFPPGCDTMQLDNESPSARLGSGNWPTRITGNVDGIKSQFFAPLGCGAGGSTLLYAAALERLDPCDFMPLPGHSDNAWPISFEQLLPYYRMAEKLFGVRGTTDPLCPSEEPQLPAPPALAECDQHFLGSLGASGLHPYRLHIAYGYEPGCKECGGYICARGCKADARTVCLKPALRTGNAHIIDRCEVERLVADATTVKEIVCRRDGGEFVIRARVVVLAASAYFSPVLLLKSTNEHWPHGLANRSGMVGRNLMFHVSDLVAVWPRGKYSMDGPRKTLAFRDFYIHQGVKLGSVQSTGLTAGYGNIVYFFKTAFDRSRWSWLKPVRPLLRIPAYLAAILFGRATIFATIMEDRPYPDNRIVLDPDEPSGMRFDYTVHTELRERASLLKGLVKKAFGRHRLLVISQEVNLNYGHPSGTCRFGADPSSSVLDPNNKAHDLDNLYVVDASFMPTSGGANPSLTIAANALRVAEHICDTLQSNKP
ncbi:MAG: glucose-methanol-choline oxidoreductase [Gallionellaceae bacterium]|nr:MAG: glucose-methanol-choline oxidoreductase [Gallionellaceae bacterium]